MLDSEYGVQRQAVTEQGRADPRQTLTALRRFSQWGGLSGASGAMVLGRAEPSGGKALRGGWAVGRWGGPRCVEIEKFTEPHVKVPTAV